MDAPSGRARRLTTIALTVFGAGLALSARSAPGNASGAASDVPVAEASWHLQAVDAPGAWDRALGDGAVVAIVDTGIDGTHPDLLGSVVAGADCIDTSGNPDRCTPGGQDVNGHGTHVAGLVAARGSRRGATGVAPRAHLLAVRALSRDCVDAGCGTRGHADDLAAAVRWSVAHRADVVNLSVDSAQGALAFPALADAVTDAWEAGVVVVAAAGNRAFPMPGSTPDRLVVVTSTDGAGVPVAYARGVGDARWALAAPGGVNDVEGPCDADTASPAIWSAWAAGDRYACLAGTSMAAPQVSGAIALLVGAGVAPADAVAAVLETAHDVGLPGPDGDTGAGLLDAGAAAARTLPRRSETAADDRSAGAAALAAAGLVVAVIATTVLARDLVRARRGRRAPDQASRARASE